MTNTRYILSHSDFELRRLARQAQFLEPTTRAYFQLAGMAPGMRVLDVGSGTGAVAFLAADIVGPAGEVIGTDIAPAAISTARTAAIAGRHTQVSFREGDPGQMVFEKSFDFVVGRYVLWAQAEPGEMLRKLRSHLHPGGVVLFHELDWSFVRSEPAVPIYDRCCRFIIDTFDQSNASLTGTVARLHRAFLVAGLPTPTMHMRTVIGDAVSAEAWLRAVADIVITLQPAPDHSDVGAFAHLEPDALADRLIREVASGGGIVVGRAEIGAWSRIKDQSTL